MSGRQQDVSNSFDVDVLPIPGTVHLVDLEGTMRAKHDGDVVLVPSPSNDPDDPLNWSPMRKSLSMTSMCVYTLMVGMTSAAIYSILTPMSEETGLTLGDLNAGTGYMFLLNGWGCLFWQPIALQYGKRPVYLISSLAVQTRTTTNGQWIASKVLQGFFGAPIESLCEISVADIFFTHERGTYMSAYALFLFGSNFIAPVYAGFINDALGWQWVLYCCAIFCASGFVFCFFFVEETNFDRSFMADIPTAADMGGEENNIKESPDYLDDQKGPPTETAAVEVYRKKTYLDKLRLLDKPRPNRLLRMMVRPLPLMSFPVIFYAGFCYGTNLIWFNVLNATASLILGNAPYNFRASMVGLAYLGPVLGTIVGTLYTGRFADSIVLKISRRNKGIFEPEHRLWLFTLSVVLIPGPLILWGVGAAHDIHWFGLIFAMGVIACTNVIGLQPSVNYCVDSYRALSGEAMISVIVIRNTMSFAIGYGVTPWVTDLGYQNCFISAAFAGLVQCLTFLIMVRYGRRFREASRKRYWTYVKESEALGLVH